MNDLHMPFTTAWASADVRVNAADLLTGTPDDVVHDVLLVVTELIGNVVQHAIGGGELHLIRRNDEILVEVHDFSRDLPVMQPPDPRNVGGRGLLLVSAFTRAWGSRPTVTGKVVWASVALPDLAPQAGRADATRS